MRPALLLARASQSAAWLPPKSTVSRPGNQQMHLLCLQRHVSHAALRAAILPACACRRIQAHASSCSESGVAGGTIRQSFCSALQAELAEFYHLMAVLQEQSLREAPKPDNVATGDSRLHRHTTAVLLPSTVSNKLVPYLHEAVEVLLKAKPYDA